MKYDLEQLQAWVGALRGDDPLPPHDPRYLDLENFDFQGKRTQIRTGSWSMPLLHGILASPRPTCQVFSGFAGTGKSTELLKIKAELERKNFEVLLIDMAHWHDLQHALTIEDMLVVLALAVEEKANGYAGKPSKSFFGRMQSAFSSELELAEAKVGLKLLDLKVMIKSPNEAWNTIRSRLSLSLGRLVELAHEDIERSVVRIEKHTNRSVVVILDSLEKLSGSELTFRETMLGVGKVFSHHAGFLRLPKCHTIYTIPPYTVLLNHSVGNLYDGGVIVPLPAIKVRDRDDCEYEPGLAALEALVAKRVPIGKIFGADPAPLRRLLLKSGGHARTLLKMVHDILVQNLMDDFPVSASLVDGIIARYAEQAARSIRPEGVPLLESIRTRKDIDQVEEGKLHLLARFMDHYLVLCYQNGEGWYQVHELIRENVARRAAELAKPNGG